MAGPTVSLAISHTPWVPERVKSCHRLLVSLDEQDDCMAPGSVRIAFKMFTDRAPNWVWSSQMWQWSVETDATHCLFLQDDVIPSPNFWPALRAMLIAANDRIIGLESAHPAGKTIARADKRWYTTADGLIGVGYVMPRLMLQEFLRWRAHDLLPNAVESITEDTLLDVFAISRRIRIWHPVPTIIDHDVTLDSTYGNDKHAHRRPVVTWRDGDVCGFSSEDLEQPDFWAETMGTHLGRFYAGTHWLAKQWVKGFSQETWQAAEADSCPEEYRRWF